MYILHIEEVDMNKKSNISLIYESVKLIFFFLIERDFILKRGQYIIVDKISIVIKFLFFIFMFYAS